MSTRVFAPLVLMASCLCAQPRWATPGTCLTPSGTLCRTLVYEESGWTNQSWGFHAIKRYTAQWTEAVSHNGNAVLRRSFQSYTHYLFPAESYDRVRIVFPEKKQTIEIEHSRKEFRDPGGLWEFSEYWNDESDCSKRAGLAGKMAQKTGNEPVAAGIKGIEYTYETEGGRWAQRIAFAPSLGCTAILFSYSSRNAGGLLTSTRTLRLVSASLEEPDAGLFSVPPNYQPMHPGEKWPYVWLDSFPGSITATSFTMPGCFVPTRSR